MDSQRIRGELELTNAAVNRSGLLIINADDWGRNNTTTDRIAECAVRGAISSVSAMVFMDDSERASALASEREIDAGLHLNLTSPFSAPSCPGPLAERQQQIAKYLVKNRLSQIVFHPGLKDSFNYVVSAQIDEFCRIYGAMPKRIDGHHHMHLCANVLFGGLLPSGTIVRRNFSFQRGEKSAVNRMYRGFIDRRLARCHSLTDYFFSLPPLEPIRLRKILSLALRSVVELETHPINSSEYEFLTTGEIFNLAAEIHIARSFSIPGIETRERAYD
jgi:chitin disaccharide deacetylase